MSDDVAGGFSHHHSDESLRRWRTVPAERRLAWLHEALEMTRSMLPAARRRARLAMRGEEPGASVSIESLLAEWPAFTEAVDRGADAVEVLFARLLAREHSARRSREILLALREWLPFRPGARATDGELVDASLRRTA